VRRFLRRVRLRLQRLAVSARQGRAVAGADVALQHRGGRWVWAAPGPTEPLATVRARQLGTVVEALARAAVPHVVVPDPEELHPQIGIPEERWVEAMTELRASLRGRAWYARDAVGTRLVDAWRPRLGATSVTLGAWYGGSPLPAFGDEVAVTVVPWRLRDGHREAAITNHYSSSLPEPAFAATAEVRTHGRSWVTALPFAGRHPRQRPPGTWVVPLPAEVAAVDHELAVALAAGTAEAVRFSAPLGAEIAITLPAAIGEVPGLPAPSYLVAGDDEVARLRATSVQLGPVIVVPAGCVPLKSLRPARLGSPGGVHYFTPRQDRLDQRPVAAMSTVEQETRRLRAWFAATTGSLAPWVAATAPYQVTSATTDPTDDVLDGPDRPHVVTTEAALSVLTWIDYVALRAVPARLRVREFALDEDVRGRTLRAVARPGRVEFLTVPRQGLLEVADAQDAWWKLVRRRVPAAAEGGQGDPRHL
jgi:hypothetical protein